MKVFNTSFTLSSEEGTEVTDITKLVREAIQQFPVSAGIALINTLHTTCALFINEFQSALIDDLRPHGKPGTGAGGLSPRRPTLLGLRARQRPLAPALRAARALDRRRPQQRRAGARTVPVDHLRGVRRAAEARDHRPGHRGIVGSIGTARRRSTR